MPNLKQESKRLKIKVLESKDNNLKVFECKDVRQ